MKKWLIVLFTAVLVMLCAWIWHGNNTVELNVLEIKADVPEEFDGFTIVQISDLHNCELGENNIKVIEAIKQCDADIIVMTGDIVDSRNTKIDVAVKFIKEAVKIAPCYFVTGNHEARVNMKGEYEVLKEAFVQAGVRVLENEATDITINGKTIDLIGIQDTGFDLDTGVDYLLAGALPDSPNFKILLAHRPEYFELYEGVDLIFSGHAHGGQIRLPFIGGLYAPGQGLLPKYDSGIYVEDGREMVVNRGLGNSLFPVRINNKPEVVAVKLKKG